MWMLNTKSDAADDRQRIHKFWREILENFIQESYENLKTTAFAIVLANSFR